MSMLLVPPKARHQNLDPHGRNGSERGSFTIQTTFRQNEKRSGFGLKANVTGRAKAKVLAFAEKIAPTLASLESMHAFRRDSP